MQNKLTNQIVALLLLVGILVFVYNYMLNIIMYFIIAWVVSMVGMPVMNFFMDKFRLNKIKAGKNISAILVLFVMLVFFSLFFVLILPPLVNQIDILTSLDYNKVFEPLHTPVEQFRNKLIEYNLMNEDDLNLEKSRELLMNLFNVDRISSMFSNIINYAGNFMVSFFAVSFFFLKDSSIFSEIIISVAPEKHSEKIKQTLNEISSLLKRYFSGIFLQMFILFLFVFIVLSLFGIQDALIIAVFAAILNIIPYVGPIIGAAFGVLIVFTNNIGFDFYDVILTRIIIVGGTFIAMQSLDNYILQPMIYSDKIKAHPLEIFVVILLGSKVYGIIGMVLAIPVYIILRAIAKVFFSQFRFVQKISQNT